MDVGDPDDEIARLEAEIEKLAEAAERCRKIMLMSKAAIAVGTILLLATTVRAISFDPRIAITAAGAILGGIVVLGSNSTTWRQTVAAMKSAEAVRAELIGRIDLRVVEDGIDGDRRR